MVEFKVLLFRLCGGSITANCLKKGRVVSHNHYPQFHRLPLARSINSLIDKPNSPKVSGNC